MDSPTDAASFAALLRSRRLLAGLTQERLAERARLSVRTVRSLESGRTDSPRPHTVALLADACELNGEVRQAFLAAAHCRSAPDGAGDWRPPAPLTPLIGRARQLEGIRAALRGGARLITLTGLAGVGKTRLALEVAGSLEPPDVVWVPGAQQEGIRDAPADRPTVAFLDACEQVPLVASMVEDILSSHPNLSIVATSRRPLGIVGEYEYSLGPLPLPVPDTDYEPDELADVPAVRLLVDRITARRTGFGLDRSNAAAIAQLCRRLGGLPLALELAAAQCRVRDPADLLAQPAGWLLDLADPRRPGRHARLRAAISGSVGLLTETDQRALAHLSVFAGGWTLGAAAAVLGEAGKDAVAVHDVLIGHGLVSSMDTPDGRRFWMPDPINEYAAETATAGRAGAMARHAAYFGRLVEVAVSGTLPLLDTERDNIRTALHWYRRYDPAGGMRIVDALPSYRYPRSHLDEGAESLSVLPHRRAINGETTPTTLATDVPHRDTERNDHADKQCLGLHHQFGSRQPVGMTQMKRLVVVGTVLSTLTTLGATGAADAASVAAEPCDPGSTTYRYVVLFDPHTSRAAAEAQIRRNCGVVDAYHPQIGVAVASSSDPRFDARFGSDRAFSAKKARDTGTLARIRAVEQVTASVAVTPAEDLSGQQWDLRAIKADQAHQVSIGSRRVVVGVLDTGVDAAHPDLAHAIDKRLSAGCATGVADPSEAAWAPQHWHGTAVAGAVAAARDGLGITGVAPGVRIAAVQVMNEDGYMDPENVVYGFMWAAANRFTITNGSWSTGPWFMLCRDRPGEKVAHEAVRRAVEYATRGGVLHVASAGNAAMDLAHPTADPFRPGVPIDAACELMPNEMPDVALVSATGYHRRLAGYSDYGAGAVYVAAPGGDRAQAPPPAEGPACPLSTLPGGGYGTMCGTSAAAPRVAGVAALIASRYPFLAPAHLRKLIAWFADPIPCSADDPRCTGPEWHNSFFGHGTANALKAVGG